MELDPVERPGAMSDSHDFTLVGPGADDEVGMMESFAADHQAVVAGGLEWIGKPLEDSLAVVVNPRGLAVHDAVIADDLATEHVPDALMTQTDTQNGNRGSEPLDHLVRYASLPRRARPGRNDDVGR